MSNYRKNNARKVMTTSAAAALATTAIAPAVASADSQDFSDVPNDHAYAEQINALAEAGIVQGDENGNFNPEDGMSRASAAEMLAKALDLQPEGENTFSDVPDDHWAVDSITALYEAGVVQGDADGDFNPSDDLSRAAIAEMVVKAYGLELDETNEVTFDDVDEGEWYANNVHILASHGLVEGNGEGQYSPENDMQRQHFAKLVYDAEVAYGDMDEPPEDLTVESVSAVNGSTVQVTFSEDVETATTSNFVFSNSVEATDVEIDGNKVLVSTTDIPSNVNISVAIDDVVGVNGGTLENVTSSFQFAVEAETTIQGFVYDDHGNAVSGATVKAGEAVATTNKDGYYKLPANSGLVSVEVTKEGHFNAEENVVVTRNNETAENFTLSSVDVDQLQIEGNVVDDKTGNAVSGATVKLQEKQGSEWVDVTNQVATTDSNGRYGFYNSEATDVDTDGTDSVEDASEVTFQSPAERINMISADKEYRVVTSKGLPDSKLDSVYVEGTKEFVTSDAKAETVVGSTLEPVEQVEEFKVMTSWADNSDVTGPTSNDTDVTVELLDTTGQNVLASETVVDPEISGMSTEYDLTNVIGDMTLPTGTYYLRVSDDTGDNAVSVVAVEVDEGGSISASNTIEASEDLTVSSTFSSYDSDQLNSGSITVPNSMVNIYQTIDGVDVLVHSANSELTYSTDENNNLVTSVDYNSLPSGSYKTEVVGDYIVGNPSDSVDLREDAVTNSSIEVDPAGSISTDDAVKLLQEDGSTVLDLMDGSYVTATFELMDENGETVQTEEVNVYDKENGTNVSPDSEDGLLFGGVEPGNYTLKVTAGGFEDKTTVEFGVNEFTNTNGSSVLPVSLVQNPEATVQGYVRFEDTLDSVEDGQDLDSDGDTNSTHEQSTVYVYDQNGNYVTHEQVVDGTYTLGDDETLEEGSYNLVVRGYGQFETVAQTVNVNVGEQTVNFEVAEGAKAMTDLTLVDSLGNKVSDSDVNVTVTDSYYDDHADPSAVTVPGTDGAFTSQAMFAAGTYTVAVNDTSSDNKYLDTATQLDVGKNATEYARVTVPTAVSGVTFNVSGDITNVSGGQEVYVAAIDVNGNVVDHERATVADDDSSYSYNSIDVPNGNYTIAAFVDGNYVGDKDITVEDADQSTVDIALTPANR